MNPETNIPPEPKQSATDQEISYANQKIDKLQKELEKALQHNELLRFQNDVLQNKSWTEYNLHRIKYSLQVAEQTPYLGYFAKLLILSLELSLRGYRKIKSLYRSLMKK